MVVEFVYIVIQFTDSNIVINTFLLNCTAENVENNKVTLKMHICSDNSNFVNISL